jgi:hypothetical protein
MRSWTLALAVVALAFAAGAWGQEEPSPAAPTPVPGEVSPPAAPAPVPGEVSPPAAAAPVPGEVSPPAAPSSGQIPVAQAVEMKQAGTPTLPSEHVRCVATCATVMPYYQQRFAALQTHDGDTQCWANCWRQFGDSARPNPTADQQRQLWRSRSPQYMRANQCAQTCWRKYHPQDTAVLVAGLPSLPRPIVGALLQAASQVFAGQPLCLAAVPMVMVPAPVTTGPPPPCPPVTRSGGGQPPECPVLPGTY